MPRRFGHVFGEVGQDPTVLTVYVKVNLFVVKHKENWEQP